MERSVVVYRIARGRKERGGIERSVVVYRIAARRLQERTEREEIV